MARRKSKAPRISASDIHNLVKGCSPNAVTTAFPLLGPITSYTDLLDNSKPRNKAICLAAEQVVHMAESWRYFSSAMNAYLNHETGNAVHLAYYAELRATLSIFSGAGIRINKEDAYWLDAASGVHAIPKHNTHTLVWEIWEGWIKRSDAKALLENNIRIEAGVALKDFEAKLKQFSPGALLNQWGFDLVNLSDDHFARNEASYIAYWRDKPFPKMGAAQLDFVKTLTELFLSSGTGLLFDKALIQYAVHQTVEASLDQDPAALPNHPADRKAKLGEIANYVAKQTGANEDHLLKNLSSNIGESIFEKAKTKSNEAEFVLSRAAFLARLAMLSVRQNIASAGNAHAKSWLVNWLEHCGTWQPTLGGDLPDIEMDLIDALSAFPPSYSEIPADLWNIENAYTTTKITNLHACIAWGAAT